MTVLLTEFLPAEHIVVPLKAAGFREAVQELLGHLHGAGAIRDLAAAQRVLAGARGRDVVAIRDEVALPHLRTEAVDQLVLGIGVARVELDVTGAGLSHPPRVIALVLAPPEAAARYLQTVAALARLFHDPGTTARVIGARTAADVYNLPELKEARVQPDLRVRDLMARRAEGVSPTTTVRDAVDLMLRNQWRALPVLGPGGEVLGIISEWDVMRVLLPEIPTGGAAPGSGQTGPPVLVRDAMTRSVLCVSEEMDIEEAAHMMINKNVEQFPVVNESVLTGMLFRSDIIRKLFGR